MELSRKELFKYLGTLGLAVLVITYLWYSTTEVMGKLKGALLIAGGVLVLISIIVNIGDILAAFQKRSTRLGANSALVMLAGIAIFAFINFLGYRHHKKIDLTAEKRYSLSEQTIAVLAGSDKPEGAKGLQKDVKIYNLSIGKSDEQVADLVEQYRYYSPRVTYERVDLQAHPERARQFQGVRPGETVVATDNRTEKLTNIDEQTLTSAIMKVTREKAKTVCFIEGHGERELTGNGTEGYGAINTLLRRDNYETKAINLSAQNANLTDCAVLVLAGPNKPLFPAEAETLSKYLADGGKALLAVDPDSEVQVNGLLKDWNVELRKDVVIEPTLRVANLSPAYAVVREFGQHAITNKFRAGSVALFPLAQSIKTDTTKSDVTITDLFKTSAAGYGKTDNKSTSFAPTEGKDNKGPLTIGVAAEKKIGSKDSRLVVIGDSDFAVNEWVQQTNNGDLFVNAVNWLAQEEDLISIRPKSQTDRNVQLSAIAEKILFWLTLVLPLAVIGAGIQIWWKRR